MKKLLFESSSQPTLGVEIELQVLDPESFDLVPHSETLLKLCKESGIERVKAEIHQSMLEIDSEISLSVKECRQFLQNRLLQLNSIAESAGFLIGSTGTHPFQNWTDRLISNVDRYQYLHKKFQWLARRMNVYGLHVHIGMPSGSRALEISQLMTPYQPLLIALSANSPFWHGVDTGMQSSRISILESFPFSGVPPVFDQWEDFEHYYHTLSKLGAISSLKDLYWYVRPNPVFGTIEFRICDTMPKLSETLSLVAFIHCLTVWMCEQLDAGLNCSAISGGPPVQWMAPHNQWVAARDGINGVIIANREGKKQKIADLVLEWVERLSPIAVKLNCKEELEQLRAIVSKGNGAQRQRAIYEKSYSFQEVVASANREFKEDLFTCCGSARSG